MFSCKTMAPLAQFCPQFYALACVMRCVYHVSYGHWNRTPGEARTFATTIHRQAFIPKNIPSAISAKARVSPSRAADVMRGREVPLSPKDHRTQLQLGLETEQRRLQEVREAEEKRRQKTRDAKEELQREAARRFNQQLQATSRLMKAFDSQMASIGTQRPLSVRDFLNDLLKETRLHARSMLVDQRSREVALVILEEFSGTEMSEAMYSVSEIRARLVTARDQRLDARRLHIEEQCRLIALVIVRKRFESAESSSAMSLTELLAKLERDRQHRWTHLFQKILEQKEVGGPQDSFKIASTAVDYGLREVIAALEGSIRALLPGLTSNGFFRKVLSLEGLSRPIAGLFFCRQSLKELFATRDAHILRSLNRVKLRCTLAPEIFGSEARHTLLEARLSETENSANEIWILAASIRKETSFTRYGYSDERMRILVQLLKARAHAARELGRSISGFYGRLPPRSGRQGAPQSHHKYILEAELHRVCGPIIRFIGELGSFNDTAATIFNNNPYSYKAHGVYDRLADLRHMLSNSTRGTVVNMVRQLHESVTEMIFWRGIQLQYQSQWGQASHSRYSHQSRTDVASSANLVHAKLPHLAHDAVERHTNSLVDWSHTSNILGTRGPAISYVTTWKFAQTVLEEFRSTSVLGLAIQSFPQLNRVPSKSHRSQIQALVLASENHVAIFHIALLEGWSAGLVYIPLLQKILESNHVLKVGVGMDLHAQYLKDHTTVDMENFVDLNKYAARNDATRENADKEGEWARYDGLSELTLEHYGRALPSLSNPQNITNDGLVRASYIQCGFGHFCII